MEADLRDLYQQVILDHHRRPRNFRAVEGENRSAEGYNPLCGDRVKVALKVAEDGRIEDERLVDRQWRQSRARHGLPGRAVERQEQLDVAHHVRALDALYTELLARRTRA